jgi:hypothetical protein
MDAAAVDVTNVANQEQLAPSLVLNMVCHTAITPNTTTIKLVNYIHNNPHSSGNVGL